LLTLVLVISVSLAFPIFSPILYTACMPHFILVRMVDCLFITVSGYIGYLWIVYLTPLANLYILRSMSLLFSSFSDVSCVAWHTLMNSFLFSAVLFLDSHRIWICCWYVFQYNVWAVFLPKHKSLFLFSILQNCLCYNVR
jgi:hypothetical protein